MSAAPVEAVAAWTYPRVGYGWYGTVPAIWEPAADTQTMLDETVDAVLGAVEGARVGRRVIEGLPAMVLVEASREASALVVGSRGHGGFAGLLLGSVSSACAEHAHCPVVVLHGTVVAGTAADTPENATTTVATGPTSGQALG